MPKVCTSVNNIASYIIILITLQKLGRRLPVFQAGSAPPICTADMHASAALFMMPFMVTGIALVGRYIAHSARLGIKGTAQLPAVTCTIDNRGGGLIYNAESCRSIVVVVSC